MNIFFDKKITTQSKVSFLLKGYWIIFWIFPCYFLSIFSASKPHTALIYILWPCISLSMILARYFDIKYLKGKTILGYNVTRKDFYFYLFFASIPTVLGEGLYFVFTNAN